MDPWIQIGSKSSIPRPALAPASRLCQGAGFGEPLLLCGALALTMHGPAMGSMEQNSSWICWEQSGWVLVRSRFCLVGEVQGGAGIRNKAPW